MAEPSELNLWTRQWRAERIRKARADHREREVAFASLHDKTTDYALSLKMARDVCAQVLALWEASPVDLPAAGSAALPPPPPESDWLDDAMKLAENYARAWQHDADGSFVIKDQAPKAKAALRAHLAAVPHREPPSQHVCGLQGYNGMIDPPCPACEANRAAVPHRESDSIPRESASGWKADKLGSSLAWPADTSTDAAGVRCKQCGVAPGSVVQVGWICREDLARLLQTGVAEVYEERQEFRLLAEQEQFAVYVSKDAGVPESDS